MEAVERYPKIIHHGRPDRLGMADNDDRSALALELLKMSDHSALQCTHAFAARWTRAAAPFIPPSPSLVRCKIGKRRAVPLPHIDLVEPGCNLHRTAASVGNDGCRL